MIHHTSYIMQLDAVGVSGIRQPGLTPIGSETTFASKGHLELKQGTYKKQPKKNKEESRSVVFTWGCVFLACFVKFCCASF
jgi:hypothetical protein